VRHFAATEFEREPSPSFLRREIHRADLDAEVVRVDARANCTSFTVEACWCSWNLFFLANFVNGICRSNEPGQTGGVAVGRQFSQSTPVLAARDWIAVVQRD